MASVLCCNDRIIAVVKGSSKYKQKILKLQQKKDFKRLQESTSFKEWLGIRFYHYHEVLTIKEKEK
jgi:hypothetical protein